MPTVTPGITAPILLSSVTDGVRGAFENGPDR